MKSKVVFLIILFIIGLAIYGYFKATPGVDNKTKAYPKIVIDPTFFDFGKVKYGKIAKHTFIVKNSGMHSLKIKRVTTSCSCTTAEVSKEEVSPGEEVKLKVVYDTGKMSGSFAKGNQERIIYVKSNDPVNPQIEVKIEAIVE